MDLKDQIQKLDSSIKFEAYDKDIISVNIISVGNHKESITLSDYHCGRYVLDDGGDLFANTYNCFAHRLNQINRETPEAKILKKFGHSEDVIWGMSCFLAGEKIKKLCELASNKKVTYFYAFKFRKYNKFNAVIKASKVEDLVSAIHKFVEIRSKALQACKETVNSIINNEDVFNKYFEKIKQNALSQRCAHDKNGNYSLSKANYFSDKNIAKRGLRKMKIFAFTNFALPVLLVMLVSLIIPNIILFVFPQYKIQVLSFQLALMLTLFLYYLNHRDSQKQKLEITVTVKNKDDK